MFLRHFRLLGSAKPRVRARAAERLGGRLTLSSISALRRLRQDTDGSVRAAAESAWARLCVAAVAGATVKAADPAAAARRRADSSLLPAFDDPEIVRLLTEIMKDPAKEMESRAQAAEALANLGDPNGKRFLGLYSRLLESVPHPHVRMNARGQLETFYPPDEMKKQKEFQATRVLLELDVALATRSVPLHEQCVSESAVCAACAAKVPAFRCVRCQGVFCRDCLTTFAEKAALMLTERVYGATNGPTFGSVRVLDERGRAFCPRCYGNMLTRAKETGCWEIKNREDSEPSCLPLDQSE